MPSVRMWSAGIVFGLAGVIASLVAQGQESPPPQTVTLSKAIHFLSSDGQDVLVQAGSYGVQADGDSGLRLTSSEPEIDVVIQADLTQHNEELGEPLALPVAKDADEYHLVLYLPGGAGLDATGSPTGLLSRDTAPSVLSSTEVNMILDRGLISATRSVVAANAPRGPQMVMDGQATWAMNTGINLTAGVKVTIETTAITSGGDPVLHLLTKDGVELARDDNRAGGTAARLVYTSQRTEAAILIVRSRSQSTGGRCDLMRNGAVWLRNMPFGGWHVWLQNLRANEKIETVQRPGGIGGAQYVFILKNDGLGIQKMHVGGGTGFGTNIRLSADLGSRWVIISIPSLVKDHIEPVRLIRNDVALTGHDPDGDGLGSELEAAIGTCSTRTGFANNFDCSQAVDARDTDGDGINDRWELLGRRDLTPHQLLPGWGADPRHKDLFFEVDFMLRAPGETPQKMSPTVARAFASYYQDEVGSVSPLLKAYHAAVLKNPDGLPGIRVHLDTGLPPQSSDDATRALYGDWGGHNATPAPLVKDSNGNWIGADPHSAWRTYMAPARRGIFRYMLPYSSGGGSNPANTYACSGGIDSGWLLAHECGHAMGLGHSGPPGVTGVVDPNCKPNYPSPMNYAFGDGSVGFADKTGAPSLNNWALKEWNGLANSSPAFVNVLESKFRYWVDRENGHVDWNRDGVIAPAGTTVRAYANFTPSSGGCEYTRYNQSQVGGAQSNRAPALARLENRLYVFYAEAGAVKYAVSTSSWNCPVPDVTPCGTWGSERSAGLNGAGGVDVAKVKTDDSEQLLIVTIGQEGRLWERRLSVRILPSPFPRLDVWTTPLLIPGSSPASGEPSLETFNGFVHLVYKGTDGKIRFNRLNPSTGWTGEQLALTSSGTEIVSAPYASPAMVRAYLPWKPGQSQLYGAFPDNAGRLDIWWLNSGTGRWEKTDVFESRPGPVFGRPSMAWVPYQSAAESPGRLYLLYPSFNPSDPQNRPVRMMISYVKTSNVGGTMQQTEKIGLNAYFDNVWAYAYGIDLLYEPGVDSNLRAALSHLDMSVRVRPKADGIQDFAYTNYNDWEVLRVGLCENLVKEAPQPRVTCPTKTW